MTDIGVWKKASASAAQGNCVEICSLPGQRVAVRDSKDPDGPVLVLGVEHLAATLDYAKAGGLDYLLEPR